MNNCERLTRLAERCGLKNSLVTTEGDGKGYRLLVIDSDSPNQMKEVAFYPAVYIATSCMRNDIDRFLKSLRND